MDKTTEKSKQPLKIKGVGKAVAAFLAKKGRKALKKREIWE